MGKRSEQHEKRYWQILQIALDEFIAKGYYGASTREICKTAGVSSGLMFHYFNSKEDLYHALIQIGCSKLTMEYDETASPLQTFAEKFAEMLQMVAQNTFAAKMFVFMGYATFNAMRISVKSGKMLAQHDLLRQSIPLIQKGQQMGEIRPGDPHALSVAFWCALQGIAEAIALHPETPAPDTEWILDILRNKEGAK